MRAVDAQARRRFHYGVFQAPDSPDFLSIEVLGTAPLPITHIERPLIRVASFLFTIASTLLSKLARVARLSRT